MKKLAQGDRTKLTGRKKRRRLLWIIPAAAAAAVVGFFAWRHFHPPVTDEETAPVAEMVPIEKRDIENIYSATGTVISADQSSANAVSTGDDTSYPVKDVLVKVGDNVKKGDVLYTLDMTALQDDIALQEQKMALQQQSDSIDLQAAQRAVANAQAASAQQYDDATRALEEAAQDTNDSLQDQVKAQQDLQELRDEEAKAKAAYDAALAASQNETSDKSSLQAAVDEAQEEVNRLDHKINEKLLENQNYKSYDDSNSSSSDSSSDSSSPSSERQQPDDGDSELNDLYKDREDANYKLTRAQQALSSYENQNANVSDALTKAQTDYENAKSKRESAEEALKTGQSNVKTNVRALEDAGKTTNSTNRDVYESEQQAKDAAAKQTISGKSSIVDMQDQIKRARQKLENGSVIAQTDGTVTAVNITPGQVYSGQNAVVINDLQEMKVTADIDEGHIADIHVGTPVRIKTDSTKDEVLDGEVTFASLTPEGYGDDTSSGTGSTSSGTASAGTASASSGSAASSKTSKAKYRVEIALKSRNERLRLGMTAKIDFVLATAKGALAVPTSAITTDDQGNSFITLMPSSAGNASEGMTEAGTIGTTETYSEDQSEGVSAGEGSNSDNLTDSGSNAQMETGTAPSEGTEGTAADGTAAGGDAQMSAGSADSYSDEQSVSADEAALAVQTQVTTGIADNYYTQIIAPGIKEGDYVELPSADAGGSDSGMLEGVY